jgi:cytochrome c556
MDLKQALKYCSEVNDKMHDLFDGVPIYQTIVSHKLHEIWKEAYDFEKSRKKYKHEIKMEINEILNGN